MVMKFKLKAPKDCREALEKLLWRFSEGLWRFPLLVLVFVLAAGLPLGAGVIFSRAVPSLLFSSS